KFGRDKMQQYLGLFKDGVEAEEGLMKVYGYNYDSLNTVWQSNLKTGFQVNNHYFLPVLSGIFLPVRLNMGKAW
ncbi:MAG: hypothetical protein U1D67_05960, partial [Dehalococcoidia bacterium]|nr:hypothetical protein [Dehalococcoidia bacterium]